jgi:Fe-S-cluster-containing hydrogenase component 2
MPTVRRLVMLYALAGVDCVDVAADPAVVMATRQGLADAVALAPLLGDRQYLLPDLPWLMVSLNDSEDPHFRKATLDASHCPPDCDRPCEAVCPTAAIQFQGWGKGGVTSDLCYGCGRCLSICPIDNIGAQHRQARPEDFSGDRLSQIDAVEIHTQVGRQTEFAALWQRLAPWRPYLKLVSISCPDDEQVVPYLQELYEVMAPLAIPLIWQTDGRPMSGDLGRGTTHATIRLARKVLAARLPGYVQAAGGTNSYTVSKLREFGLVHPQPPISGVEHHPRSPQTISGIAYGSYARRLVMPLLSTLDTELQNWLDAANIARTMPCPSRVRSQAGQAHPMVVDSLSLAQPRPWNMSTLPVPSPGSALEQGLKQARDLVEPLKAGGVI